VQDILRSHNAPAAKAAPARPKPRAGRAEPLPTEAVPPACWSLPLWLGWLPSLATVLGLGVLGLALACVWAVDARKAAAVSNLLASGAAEIKPLPANVEPPDGSWWKSTAVNLMHWALYFDRRSTAEPENVEQAMAMLRTAARTSPIQAQVRFAWARRPSTEDDPQTLLGTSLGLSRDVVSLNWAANQWLKAGKTDAALKTYREALEMAARAELSRLPAPAFDEDPQIKRYRIPGEDLAGMVIRDMADHAGWTFAEWSRALPSFAVARLAAARLLRERGNPDADRALDSILEQLDAPAPAGCPAALHRAAQAEALALRSQWAPAEARYREAIAMMPSDATRRSWWMNVADIALKLNDEPGRQKALESAKGLVANDEIAYRAIEILKYSIVRADKPRSSR
jgi:hypothetical protein